MDSKKRIRLHGARYKNIGANVCVHAHTHTENLVLPMKRATKITTKTSGIQIIAPNPRQSFKKVLKYYTARKVANYHNDAVK